MKVQLRIPRFVTSSLEAGPGREHAVLDGGETFIANRWRLPPHTVALIGRPAVWSIVDIATPRVTLGVFAIPAQRWHLEQDFGGHLFLIVTTEDGARASVIEAGPEHRNGTGALLPYSYPEDEFVSEGALDFEPLVVAPPSGLRDEDFAHLVRRSHREYDGNQRYLAIEIPFLRVGRDSNSYVVGVLLASGVDPRAVPKPRETARWEWTGYPGMEDPVHRANFGAYLGAPSRLDAGVEDVAYHGANGDVIYAVVGGPPHATVRLPSGDDALLDDYGRIVFSPGQARERGLPTVHTHPPAQIAKRVRFPGEPAPAGAEITLVIDGKSVALEAGSEHTGVVVARNDALGLATLRTNENSDIVLPLAELGVELRDPKRVDRLLQVGHRLTVGLRRDRHPRLISRGPVPLRERLGPRRFHAPRWVDVIATGAVAVGAAGALLALAYRRR